MYIFICGKVMKTIQCGHPSHHRNGFVATVHALLVLESTECSTSTKQLMYLRSLLSAC